MDRTRSDRLFARARQLLPGGVSSPVRAYGSVGGTPPFVARAQGPRLWDVDGNEYLDLVGSWGPMLLGHAHPDVIAAVQDALVDGTSFGAPIEGEVALAEAVLDRYPGCERVRFTNSGTEATMSALRVARAATGRELIVKFAGNYHGHADGLLVAAGSGAMTHGVPSSAGVPEGTAATTLVADYGDVEGLQRLFAERGDDVAAVIYEPVAGNMGVVAPPAAFHEALRQVTRDHGALLIADEVMSGFRVARGGAVERYGLEPDLVAWGKIIGGGLPVGGFGGPADVMDRLSPSGPVYHAGTLSGNPLAMAAGLATLQGIDRLGDVFETLEARGAQLEQGLCEAAKEAGVPLTVNRVGSMITPFFGDGPVTDAASAQASDKDAFGRWFHAMLARGVYWPASQFESAFLSYAHGEGDVATIVDAAQAAFREVAA